MRAVLLVTITALVAGCDPGYDLQPIGVTFSVLPREGELFAARPGYVDLAVEVTAYEVAGPIQVSMLALPAGLTTTPVTIAPGRHEVTLHLTAAPGRYEVAVQARTDELLTRAFVQVEVGIAGGALDRGYAGEGVTRVDRDGADDVFTDAALAPDQRVVLVGTSDRGALLLARTDVDGGLDPAFAGGAVITGAAVEGAPEVEVDHDGRPLVLSTPSLDPVAPSTDPYGLRRWSRTGEPDPSFAPVRGGVAADASGLVVWRTGQRDPAYEVGWVGASRYFDGEPDRTWSIHGERPGLDSGTLAGTAGDGTGGLWIVSTRRLLHVDRRGEIDRDDDGEIIPAIPAELVDTRASIGVAPTADGGVVVAGLVTRDAVAAAVARYDATGATTPAVQVPGFRRAGAVGCAVALDAEQRALVTCPSDRGDRLRVARLLPDGRLDVRFGQRGVVEHALGVDVVPVAIFVDERGRIVVAGSLAVPGRPGRDGFVARLLP